MELSSVVIDSNNADKLSEFYKQLLNWDKKVYDHGENGIWVSLSKKADSTTRLVFQQVDNYTKPTWSKEANRMNQKIHLDFYSDDVEKDVKRAIGLGATLSETQTGDWIVLVDPAGHPFCIVPTRKR